MLNSINISHVFVLDQDQACGCRATPIAKSCWKNQAHPQ